ncbi:MAG: preprotein translocase subunit SecY [Ruminococcaceae bacterium]|nr:preprotein translocase subunit SecY [Oscillospiraceae bacterium]
MFKTIRNAWSIPDVRKKILFTLLILAIYRIGCVIPVPLIDVDNLSSIFGDGSNNNNLLAYLDTISGGAMGNATLFAMGITPYINSSIIIQLLCVAIPALERLSKEGEDGRKKIATITRYLTVGLGLIQGTAFFFYLKGSGLVLADKGTFAMWFAAFVIVLSFTAGTALIMWLGEQINSKGIGNGISMILFAGIVAGLPKMLYYMFPINDDAISNLNVYGSYWTQASVFGKTQYYVLVPLFILLFLAMIWVITFMQDAERRIPVQYAKRVVGRKMYGGQSSNLPIKVAMGGVMPVIFASSILSIPSTIDLFVDQAAGGFADKLFKAFSPSGWLYLVLSFLLILAFAYFYTTIQYNPIEMANNLKQNNGTIPGIRPGSPTADFIKKILSRITLIGALFLAFIYLVPSVYTAVTKMTMLSMGGTSIIIVVGVALETVKQLESQMMMRHYKGFLD